jgi:putative membrane-bound dehydrogenase-like protein
MNHQFPPASFCDFQTVDFNPPLPLHSTPLGPPLRRGGNCSSPYDISFSRSAWELASRRSASRLFLAAIGCIAAASSAAAQDAPPCSLDPHLKIELFAEHPQIVTPTGIDVDHKGRVWAIESNTHFPPEGYKGHPTDRVLVMSDTNDDGKADRIVVFTDGLKHTMSVAVRPKWLSTDPASRERKLPGGTKSTDGPTAKSTDETEKDARTNQGADAPRSPVTSVYIATRREISLFHDDDGDDKADRNEQIIHLETEGDYPHNGLAGMAFDALGWLYFGFGENLGADYKIIGSDEATLSGGGEGGCVCRCRLDGSKLERWATGFWNPHASCFDAFGRLFTVDNDPDSRPPCRLIHIIPGGDYGYRFRNGRAGLHPFTSWNGEIPGTLPMVAGTGEAPSGIVCYESDGFPEEYIGNLLVTSWGDHRIDRFRLKPRGASFGSVAEPVIVGGENFRPVGIALAPDGSLYCTDWVKRDYTLHGNGRVWRISGIDSPAHTIDDITTITGKRPVTDLLKLLHDGRADVRRAAAAALRVTEIGRYQLLLTLNDRWRPARARIEALWSIAQVPVAAEPISDAIPDVWKSILLLDEVGQTAYRLIGTPQFPSKSYVDWEYSVSRGERTQQRESPFVSAADNAATLLAALPHAWNFKLGGLSVDAALKQRDPFLFAGVVNSLVVSPSNARSALDRYASGSTIDAHIQPGLDMFPGLTLAALLAGKRLAAEEGPSEKLELILSAALTDRDASLRRAAVQWVAEAHLKNLRPQVEAILNDSQITADLFLATLATLEMLDGAPPAQFDKTPPGKYVLPLVKDEKRTPTVRALALRMVDPADPALDAGLLASLLKGDDPLLRQEAVRTLQLAPAERAAVLVPLAADVKQDPQLRADALVGLAIIARTETPRGPARKLLANLMDSNEAVLRYESLRSARRLIADDPDLSAAVASLAAHLKPSDAGQELADQIVLAVGDLKSPLADVM